MKEAAETFGRREHLEVVVTAGPAPNGFQLYVSGQKPFDESAEIQHSMCTAIR